MEMQAVFKPWQNLNFKTKTMKNTTIIRCLMLFFVLTFSTNFLHAQDDSKDEPASAGDIAKELANPNNTLGQMALQWDFVNYQGSLPNAKSQNGYVMNFQPSLPVPLSNGFNLFVRPNIPIYLSQPVYGANGFENVGFNLGNISADIAVGKTLPSKTILIAGVFGSFRTATDYALKSNYTMLGPELMVAQIFKWGVVGAMVSHSWSVNKYKDADVDSFTILADDLWAATTGPQTSASITAGQYFYVVNLKNAWQITGQPTWSYNHNAEDGNKLTFPIATGVNKVAKFGKLPVKISLQYWYYVASPDTFGPQHQIRLQFSPVVPLPW